MFLAPPFSPPGRPHEHARHQQVSDLGHLLLRHHDPWEPGEAAERLPAVEFLIFLKVKEASWDLLAAGHVAPPSKAGVTATCRLGNGQEDCISNFCRRGMNHIVPDRHVGDMVAVTSTEDASNKVRFCSIAATGILSEVFAWSPETY